MPDDARYALRSFRRTPQFTLGALITLALGIGAATAIFSVVDRILFRPLPYPEGDRLVSVGYLVPVADNNEFLPVPAYLRMRELHTVFSGTAAFGFTSDCDLNQTPPLRAQCTRVDADFLPTFGIAPLAGRFFSGENEPAALLSFTFWSSRFGGDRGIVGQSIRVDGQPFTVVGILPRDFELFNLSPTDILLPAGLAPDQQGRVVRAFRS